MKVNNDKHEVHLSREMYDALLAWATVGVQESYSSEYDELTPLQKIKWHARKFNTQLHIERDQELAKEEREKRKTKRLIRSLLSTNRNSYVLYHHPTKRFDGNRMAVFYPVCLIARYSRDKSLVLVKHPDGTKEAVDPNRIHVGIPEGAVHWTEGPWAGKVTLVDEGRDIPRMAIIRRVFDYGKTNT